MRRISVVWVIVMVGLMGMQSEGKSRNGHSKAINRDEAVQELLKLHNAERAKESKPALKLNGKLTAAAQDYAEFLAKNQKFGHSEKGTFGSRIQEKGYHFRAAGENIAKGQGTTEAVVNGWMHSKGHRANIMNGTFKEVGFGLAKDSKGQWYWVTDFGTAR